MIIKYVDIKEAEEKARKNKVAEKKARKIKEEKVNTDAKETKRNISKN